MDNIWQKAKSFAEEAAKRSQSLTLTSSPSKIADIVSETAKRSKYFAAEASKKADELKTVADQHIKSLAGQIPSLSLTASSDLVSDAELQRFGVTDDLKQFIMGLTALTFQSFPIQDGDNLQRSDVAAVSNVRRDLSDWQQKHATIVLGSVKELSRLRYELCPRHMKDQQFWRIYFTLVNSHVAPYENNYMEELKLKDEKIEYDKVEQTQTVALEAMESSLVSKTSTSLTEQDLDTFLLGDLEDNDAEPDDDDTFDDDFDKIDGLDVEDEKRLTH